MLKVTAYYAIMVFLSFSETTADPCLAWCITDDMPWKNKCEWPNCYGCSPCAQPPVIEPPVIGRPNIVFIIADDLNGDMEGISGGHPQILTPHIRRLMDEGTTFDQAHCNVPLCVPSRASFATGIYPHTSNFDCSPDGDKDWWKNDVLSRANTMFGHFKENGYTVMGTGKVLHNNKKDEFSYYGTDSNYNRFLVDEEGNTTMHGQKWATQNIHDIRSPPQNVRRLDMTSDEESAQWATDELEKLASKSKSSSPFFLAVGFTRSHSPQIVDKKYFDLYPLDKLVVPPGWKQGDANDTYYQEYGPSENYDIITSSYDTPEEAIKNHLRGYLASVSAVDENVGVILNAIDAHPELKRNTIVMFVSDNGKINGEKEYIDTISPWQQSTHVPLVMRVPNVTAPGTFYSDTVSLIDIFPTLVDLAGLPYETCRGGIGRPLEGFSLRPALDQAVKKGSDSNVGRNREGPNAVLSKIVKGPNQEAYTLRSTKMRYIRYTQTGKEELYNTLDDPYEWINIANKKSYYEKLQKFRDKLNGRLENKNCGSPCCIDRKDKNFFFEGSKRNCAFLGSLNNDKRNNLCQWNTIKSFCPVSCGQCCGDSSGKVMIKSHKNPKMPKIKDSKGIGPLIHGKQRACEYVLQDSDRRKTICKLRVDFRTFCPKTCKVKKKGRNKKDKERKCKYVATSPIRKELCKDKLVKTFCPYSCRVCCKNKYPPDFFPTYYKEWAQFVSGSKSSSCDDIQTYNYEDNGKFKSTCIEGSKIEDGGMCTPRCNNGLVPSFAKLICKWGSLHPMGLLHRTFWTEQDADAGLQFKCIKKDPIPSMIMNGKSKPGLKRGMSIWDVENQDAFYKKYDLAKIGWWYNGFTEPQVDSFQGPGDDKILKNSNFFPMWSWLKTEYHDMYPGSDYIGMFNEPENKVQANLTVDEVIALWPNFQAKVKVLAERRGVPISQIKIGSPTISPFKASMLWGEEFFPKAAKAGIKIDFINVHSYTTKGGKCFENQLRDEMSFMRFKFNLPIWLTEFNCGNGYWKNPIEDQVSFMKDVLPMLESHPFVVRYNWFSSLTQIKTADLNNEDDQEFSELGKIYNTHVWDGESANPQWDQSY